MTKDAWYKFAANFAYHVTHTSSRASDDEDDVLGGMGSRVVSTDGSRIGIKPYEPIRQVSETSTVDSGNDVVFT